MLYMNTGNRRFYTLRASVVRQLFSELPDDERSWLKIESALGVERQNRIRWLRNKNPQRIRNEFAYILAKKLHTTLEKIVLTPEEEERLRPSAKAAAADVRPSEPTAEQSGKYRTVGAIKDGDISDYQTEDAKRGLEILIEKAIKARCRLTITIEPANSVRLTLKMHEDDVIRFVRAFLRGNLAALGIRSIALSDQSGATTTSQGQIMGRMPVNEASAPFFNDLLTARQEQTPLPPALTLVSFKPGMQVTGIVTRITDNRVFLTIVGIVPPVEGILPAEEMPIEWRRTPDEHMSVGQRLTVWILSMADVHTPLLTLFESHCLTPEHATIDHDTIIAESILRLCFAGLSRQEIARQLSITPNNVVPILHRGLTRAFAYAAKLLRPTDYHGLAGEVGEEADKRQRVPTDPIEHRIRKTIDSLTLEQRQTVLRDTESFVNFVRLHHPDLFYEFLHSRSVDTQTDLPHAP